MLRAAIALFLFLAATTTNADAYRVQPVIGKTYAESKEGVLAQPTRPVGAPNVVWILLDDAGFGASSAFGGQVHTPTFDALADAGLRYTNFHTTGVCSPTRAALLTGRNHHAVGMGLFPHKFLSAEFPGYTGRLEPQNGTIAQYLRAAGYGTYALGKWHQTPDDELSDLGPFDRWPSGKGFDHFYGFLGGADDQYKTDLVEDDRHVKPDGRHLNAQLADKAIAYVDEQQKLAPEKPFFIYLAPGATHSPHQVEANWIEKYKGQFDEGWDVYREKTFARQKRLGVIPANAVLPPRDERVAAWNSLGADQKKLNARFMEAYAGFLEYTDYEIGRVVEHLRSIGEFDNTAIFVIIGDNGASKEGSYNGTTHREFAPLAGDDKAQTAALLAQFDEIGTKTTYTNYPIGWAQALNTPFRRWKADANTEGGTRNPLIVSWPKGISQPDGIRTQYGHVNDLVATTLELTGSPFPAEIGNVEQTPLQGTSLVYSFNDANAATQHTQQYHFLFGAGSIIKDGWKASFGYRPDFVDLYGTYPAPKVVENHAGQEVWELYDLNSDPTETRDVAKQNAAKLAELKLLFDEEARANNVYPLLNWSDLDVKIKALRQ